MTEKWSKIIDCLWLMKPETVNKDKVLEFLWYDHTVDEQVLDNLFIIGILNPDDYKKHLEKVIEDHELRLKHCKERVKRLEEKGSEFNPMMFYGFGRMDYGRAVEGEIDTAWRKGHTEE